MKYFWLFQRFTDLGINPITNGFVTIEHGEETYGKAENVVNWSTLELLEIRGNQGNYLIYDFSFYKTTHY